MLDFEELLIFDYTPNLKIVGTHHALNEADKQILESLIDESDFVALEWDDFRSETGEAYICVSNTKKGYYPENRTFYAGRLDVLFYGTLFDIFEKDVVEGAKSSGRNVNENEFEFCRLLCKEKSKDVYLVDIPEHTFMNKLFSLSTKQKLWGLINLKFFKKFTPELDKLLMEEREEYMFKQIEKHEGPIIELKRKGILVVGYTHAENYLNKIKEQTIDEAVN